MTQRMVAGTAMQMGVRVLQASSMELGQIVREALESNPALEEERPDDLVSLEEPFDEGRDDWSDGTGDDWESYMTDDAMDRDEEAGGYDSDAVARHDFAYDSIAGSHSLSGYLREQILRESLPGDVERASLLLVDYLDERGFFSEDPEEIAEENGVSRKTLKEALEVLRGLEPDGVGARDLRDSLMIQLEHGGAGKSLAFRMVRDCWDDLARHRYREVAEKLRATTDEVTEAMEEVARMNPNPGAIFSRETNPYIAPDVLVEEDEDGSFDVLLTGDYVPRLRLDDSYKEALSEYGGNAEVRDYLKRCFREGRNLIRAIAQRQETILQVARVLVRKQEAFFRKGDRFLVPLGMEAVADELGVHVSTVSRAVAGKYLLCKWGYRELRSFFGSGVQAAGEHGGESGDGDALAAVAVQTVMKEILEGEPSSKPYSDAALTRELENRGIRIARRTVTKYREQMKVLPASLRRKG